TTRSMSDKKLEENLAEPLAGVILASRAILPTVALVLADRSEKTTRAIVDLARDKPKLRKALEKAAKIGPASELVQTAAYVVLAALLDLGKLDITHPLAAASPVAPLYYSIHDVADSNDGSVQTQNSSTEFAYPVYGVV
ncbi:MAG: hypothetical protein ACREHG_00440, partial [Candidatus Saccharimonadales bacterium]